MNDDELKIIAISLNNNLYDNKKIDLLRDFLKKKISKKEYINLNQQNDTKNARKSFDSNIKRLNYKTAYNFFID